MVETTSKGETRLVPTAEVERFHNADKKAVPKSSLHEEVIFNRPAYGVSSGWEKYNESRLPRKVEAAEVTCSSVDGSIVKEFIFDLSKTFAWCEPNSYGGTALAAYLGYLVQPIISHLGSGQMPAYFFFGATQSGKGYLSSVLPSLIYHRLGDPTVSSKRFQRKLTNLK
jgi:hypothetical protein